MSIIRSGFSAIGRLAAVALLAAAFLFGLAGVVYMSLQGTETQVPEITGKDFAEGERELAALGLKIKKRADRNSQEKLNAIIEQLPKPGDTVKTGQMIYVVTSSGPGENGDKNQTQKKTVEEDDTETIEEMIDDKPKKAKSNSNTSRKKADTTRDVAGNTDTGGSNSNSAPSNSNKKDPGTSSNPGDKSNKNAEPAGTAKPGPATKPNQGTKPAGADTHSKPKPKP